MNDISICYKVCPICMEVFKLQENNPTPSALTSLRLTVSTNPMDGYPKHDLHRTCFPHLPTSTFSSCFYSPMCSSYEPAPPSSHLGWINFTSPSHSRGPRTKRTAHKKSILQLSSLYTRHKHSSQCPPSMTAYHVLQPSLPQANILHSVHRPWHYNAREIQDNCPVYSLVKWILVHLESNIGLEWNT